MNSRSVLIASQLSHQINYLSFENIFLTTHSKALKETFDNTAQIIDSILPPLPNLVFSAYSAYDTQLVLG